MPIKWLLRSALLLLLLMGINIPTGIAQETPLIIELATPIAGFLEGGSVNFWNFEGTANQSITISAERFPPDPDSELDLLLEVFDSAGNLIATDDDSSVGNDAILFNLPLPADDTYTVKVSNLTTWAGGSYQLWIAESALPMDCQTPQGAMLTGEMPSTIVGYPVRYRVFMPPCYDSHPQRYPYILLGHGSNSSDEHWDDLGIDEAMVRGMALGRLPAMAIVLPWGGELANTNVFVDGHSWESVIIDELMPYMESSYCLAQTRELRAIGGISRGGFWAFLVAFRHPDLFSTLGGHSPFFDLYHAPASHNPLDLVMATPPTPAINIWMDRGQNDYAQANIELAHERLNANQIPHTYQLYPVGQHENAYWAAHVDDYLAFYAEGLYGKEWQQHDLALPPCP